MTRGLLSLLGKLRAPWWVALFLALGVLLLLPLTLLLDALALFVQDRQVSAHLAQRELRCPRGHRVVVTAQDALWVCSSCGFSYLGSGLSPCPRCKAIPAYVVCACGAAVPNRVWDLLGDRDES